MSTLFAFTTALQPDTEIGILERAKRCNTLYAMLMLDVTASKKKRLFTLKLIEYYSATNEHALNHLLADNTTTHPSLLRSLTKIQ